MSDPGFIAAGYALTVLVLAGYATSIRVRMRRATPSIPTRRRGR
jgi:hypothetical protein